MGGLALFPGEICQGSPLTLRMKKLLFQVLWTKAAIATEQAPLEISVVWCLSRPAELVPRQIFKIKSTELNADKWYKPSEQGRGQPVPFTTGKCSFCHKVNPWRNGGKESQTELWEKGVTVSSPPHNSNYRRRQTHRYSQENTIL